MYNFKWMIVILWIAILPIWIIGKILSNKKMKAKTKGVFIAATLLITFAICQNKSEPSDSQLIKEQLVEQELWNGSKTEVIGKYAYMELKKEQVTEDFLVTAYQKAYQENDYKYVVVLYKDSKELLGTYISSYIETDVQFSKSESNAPYMVENSTEDTITYTITNGLLKKH